MPAMARIDPFASPSRSLSSSRMQSLFLDSSPDFGPNNKSESTRVRAIGETTIMPAPVVPQISYRERSKRLKNLDDDKNALIDELIRSLDTNQHQLQQLSLDYEREAKYNRETQMREDSLQAEMGSIRKLLNRNSYVTVLIDGDNLTFSKDLLAKGECGGQEANKLLQEAVQSFAKDNLPHLDWPVNTHAKLFLNMKTAVENLIRLKLVDRTSTFESFLKGLLQSESVFDIIDTSLETNLTCKRIRESYDHDFVNVHCHQIFLAALSKNGLKGLLEQMPDIPVHERVTLLEPKDMDLADNFSQEVQSIKMSSLLLKIPTMASPKPLPPKVATPVLARIESNSSTRTANTGLASSTNTPVLSWAAMTAQPFVPKPGESRSGASTPFTVMSPTIAKAVPVKGVARNRLGQRVDKVDDSIPYQELQRIKKMKLCNIYYLVGKNACDSDCGHTHSYLLKQHEKTILKEVARMTPCFYRLECDDPECIYGHRCPQSKPGKKDCYYKEDCRFTGWGHGIDDKVVRVQNVK